MKIKEHQQNQRNSKKSLKKTKQNKGTSINKHTAPMQNYESHISRLSLERCSPQVSNNLWSQSVQDTLQQICRVAFS